MDGDQAENLFSFAHFCYMTGQISDAADIAKRGIQSLQYNHSEKGRTFFFLFCALSTSCHIRSGEDEKAMQMWDRLTNLVDPITALEIYNNASGPNGVGILFGFIIDRLLLKDVEKSFQMMETLESFLENVSLTPNGFILYEKVRFWCSCFEGRQKFKESSSFWKLATEFATEHIVQEAINRWKALGKKEFKEYYFLNAFSTFQLVNKFWDLPCISGAKPSDLVAMLTALLYHYKGLKISKTYFTINKMAPSSAASFQQEWYEKAVLLKRKKNIGNAVMFLKFSAALLCSNREKQIVLFAEMAQCYTEEKNYRKAIGILEDVKTDQVLSQEFAEKAKDVAKELFRTGKYPFSLKVYEIALTKASKIETQREILSNMSLIYYKTEYFQKAKEFGRKTIDVDPSWYKGYYRMGIALFNLGEYKESLEIFDKGRNQEVMENDRGIFITEILKAKILLEVNETLIVLIGESSDVETPTETLQMLINECSEDKTKQNWTIIRSLLKNSNGKKLNAKGVSLHHGMDYGMQLDELETLIALGADVNEYDSVNSKSILSKMLNEKLYEQAAMLIYHRALLHPNIKDTGAPVSPPFIVALLCSLQIDDSRLVTCCLEMKKFNLEAKTWQGDTALHLCCQKDPSDTKLKIMELLLQQQPQLADLTNKKKKKPHELIGLNDPRRNLFQKFGIDVKAKSTTVTFPKALTKLKHQALEEFKNQKWIEAEKNFEQLKKKFKAKFQDAECFVLVYLAYCSFKLNNYGSVAVNFCQAGDTNVALTNELVLELFGQDYMHALQSIFFDVGIVEPRLGLAGHRVLTKFGEKRYSANLGLLEAIILSEFFENIQPLQKFLETCKVYRSFDGPLLEGILQRMMELYQRDCFSIIANLVDLICHHISEVHQKYWPHCLIFKAVQHEEGDVAFYIKAAKKIKPDIENIVYKELTEKTDKLTKAGKYEKALELARQRKSLVKTLQLGKSQLRDTKTDELFLLSKSRPYLRIPPKVFQSEQDFIYSTKNQNTALKWKTIAECSEKENDKLKAYKCSLSLSTDAQFTVGVHGDVSELLIKMKQCSDAMNHAEVIVKMQPQSPKGYYWKGMAHFANEKYIESSECFIKALNHTSDDNLKYSTTMKLLQGRVKSGDVTQLSLDIQKTVAQKIYNALYDENSKESFACLQGLLLHTSLVQDIKVNETLLSRALSHNVSVDAIRVLVNKNCRIDEKSLDYLYPCLEKEWYDVCAHLINKKFSRKNKKSNPVKFTVELVLKKDHPRISQVHARSSQTFRERISAMAIEIAMIYALTKLQGSTPQTLGATRKLIHIYLFYFRNSSSLSGEGVDLLSHFIKINRSFITPSNVKNVIVLCCERSFTEIMLEIFNTLLTEIPRDKLKISQNDAFAKKLDTTDKRWKYLFDKKTGQPIIKETKKVESRNKKEKFVIKKEASVVVNLEQKQLEKSEQALDERRSSEQFQGKRNLSAELDSIIESFSFDNDEDIEEEIFQRGDENNLDRRGQEDIISIIEEPDSQSEDNEVGSCAKTEAIDFSFDGLPWEVECTQDVWKVITDVKLSPRVKSAILKKIRLLANGHWTKKLAKKVKGVSKSLKLYEARLNRHSRLIWEVAISFSPRCSMSERFTSLTDDCAEKGAVYVDKIRLWDIVLRHDETEKKVERIKKSQERGQQCLLKRNLQGVQVQVNANERVPNIYVDKVYAKEVLEVVAKKQTERVGPSGSECLFFPPASPNQQEYHIMKFYAFTSAMASKILSLNTEKIDFPFQVSELEHAIIQLEPENKMPILLLGRSGTGKTTCCLYRLWFKYQAYWQNAEHAGPHLPKFSFKKFLEKEVLVEREEKAEQVSDTNDEKEVDEKGSNKVEISFVPCLCNGPCDCDPIPELPSSLKTNEVRKIADEKQLKVVDSSAAENNEEEVEEKDEYEDIRQLMVTKNEVLVSEIRNNFRELCQGNFPETETGKNHEHSKIEKIPPEMYPLFITAKDLLILLDGSLEGDTFFRREENNEMADNIVGWGRNKTHFSTLHVLEEDDMDDDDDDDDGGGISDNENDAEHDGEQGVVNEAHPNQRKAEACQKRRPTKEVTYEVFAYEIWPHISKISKNQNCHASLVWMEIKSFIKGSAEAFLNKTGFLTKDQYVQIGKKRAPNFTGDREVIYSLFLAYQKKRSSLNYFDEMDVCFNVFKRLQGQPYPIWGFHEIYVDETQDFTQAELLLLLKCSLNPNAMFFTGDTAQSIMKGVAFRFCDLQSLFVAAKQEFERNGVMSPVMVPKQVHQLTHNYRSHSGILQLASSVVKLLEIFFPESFDRLKPDVGLFEGPKPVILNAYDFEELALLLQGTKRKTTSNIDFGAHQAVLVQSEESKRLLPPELRHGIVLSIYEAKGLEFDDVLLFNFFKDSPAVDEWRVIANEATDSLEQYEESNLEGNTGMRVTLEEELQCHSRGIKFDGDKHKLLNSELKKLYTAVTRARVNIWIYDEDIKKRAPMFEYFIKQNLVHVCNVNVDDLPREIGFAEKSTPEEWRNKAIYFYDKQLWKLAQKCAENANDETLKRKCIAQMQGAKALDMAQEWKIKKQKRILPQIHDEFSKASILFLQATLVDEAKICLKNARRWKHLADLLRKEGKLTEAAKYYKRVEMYKEAVSCYKEINHLHRAFAVLRDQKEYVNWIKLHQEINEDIEKREVLREACNFYHQLNSEDNLNFVLKNMDLDEKLGFWQGELKEKIETGASSSDCEKIERNILKAYADHGRYDKIVKHYSDKKDYKKAAEFSAESSLDDEKKAFHLLRFARYMVVEKVSDEKPWLITELDKIRINYETKKIVSETSANVAFMMKILKNDLNDCSQIVNNYSKVRSLVGQLVAVVVWLRSNPTSLFGYGPFSRGNYPRQTMLKVIDIVTNVQFTGSRLFHRSKVCHEREELFRVFGFRSKSAGSLYCEIFDETCMPFIFNLLKVNCDQKYQDESLLNVIENLMAHLGQSLLSALHDTVLPTFIKIMLNKTNNFQVCFSTPENCNNRACVKSHEFPSFKIVNKKKKLLECILKLRSIKFLINQKLNKQNIPISEHKEYLSSTDLIDLVYSLLANAMPYCNIGYRWYVHFMEDLKRQSLIGQITHGIRIYWNKIQYNPDFNEYYKLNFLSHLLNNTNPEIDNLRKNSSNQFQPFNYFRDFIGVFYHMTDMQVAAKCLDSCINAVLAGSKVKKLNLSALCNLLEIPLMTLLVPITCFPKNGPNHCFFPTYYFLLKDVFDHVYSLPNYLAFTNVLRRIWNQYRYEFVYVFIKRFLGLLIYGRASFNPLNIVKQTLEKFENACSGQNASIIHPQESPGNVNEFQNDLSNSDQTRCARSQEISRRCLQNDQNSFRKPNINGANDEVEREGAPAESSEKLLNVNKLQEGKNCDEQNPDANRLPLRKVEESILGKEEGVIRGDIGVETTTNAVKIDEKNKVFSEPQETSGEDMKDCERLIVIYLVAIVNLSQQTYGMADHVKKVIRSEPVQGSNYLTKAFNKLCSLAPDDNGYSILVDLLHRRKESLIESRWNVKLMRLETINKLVPTPSTEDSNSNSAAQITILKRESTLGKLENKEKSRETEGDQSKHEFSFSAREMQFDEKDSIVTAEATADELEYTSELKRAAEKLKVQNEEEIQKKKESAVVKIISWWRQIRCKVKEMQETVVIQETYDETQEKYFKGLKCIPCNVSIESKAFHLQKGSPHYDHVKDYEKFNWVQEQFKQLSQRVDSYYANDDIEDSARENIRRLHSDISIQFATRKIRCKWDYSDIQKNIYYIKSTMERDLQKADSKIDEEEFENFDDFQLVQRKKKKKKMNSRNDSRYGRKR